MNRALQVNIERLGTAHQTLVQGLRWSVPAGEILTLMGPSGSGKSGPPTTGGSTGKSGSGERRGPPGQ